MCYAVSDSSLPIRNFLYFLRGFHCAIPSLRFLARTHIKHGLYLNTARMSRTVTFVFFQRGFVPCTKDWKSSTTKKMNQQDESDAKRYKPGELLNCDNVGPVNPKSFEDTSSHSYGEIQAPSVCSPTRIKKHRSQDQGFPIRRLHYIQV
jgi:hypothetical protein